MKLSNLFIFLLKNENKKREENISNKMNPEGEKNKEGDEKVSFISN